MRKSIPLILTALGGIVGIVLRRWQLAAGFEPDTALPIPGAPSTKALVAWSVFVALAILVLIWKNRQRLPWDQAFSAGEGNVLFPCALTAAAVLLLVSAGAEVVLQTVAYQTSYTGDTLVARMASAALPPLRILLCLVGVPCSILWTRALYRKTGGGENVCLLALCLLYCVWLISNYQGWASDPTVMNYLYEVFAVLCALLALYYIAGYSFQEAGKPRRTVFFCLMAVYFSLVTLADQHTLAELARFGFAVLFFGTHALLILQQPPAAETPAETETEADDHA